MSQRSARSGAVNILPPDAHMYRTHKLFRYFERMRSEWIGSITIVLIVIFVRLCVGVGPYSGQGKPPMFGDFEAQRHWLEITNNLDISNWYINTTNNDLQYWGLGNLISKYISFEKPLCFFFGCMCVLFTKILMSPQIPYNIVQIKFKHFW